MDASNLLGRLLLILTLAGPAAAADEPVSPSSEASPDCGIVHEVRPGDTLSRLAARVYEDYRKWTLIYNANISAIGEDPDTIGVGMRLRIPCIGEGRATRTLPAADGKMIRLLSGGNYRPFTNRDRTDGGLFPDLLNVALRSADVPFESFGFAWEDDWSRHLEPLLAEQRYDLGFPWLKPDCERNPQRYRCRNFVFSEPMFEMLIVLFVDREDPIRFEEPSDLYAEVLCRPKGYYTHDLETNGRNWLSKKRVTLWRPDTLAECFRMLVDGGVDAVAVNEFTGRAAVHRLGLAERVEILRSRPLSIEGLHVIAHKSHPRAELLIDSVNRAIGRLKESGRYREIVDRHLSAYWSRF